MTTHQLIITLALIVGLSGSIVMIRKNPLRYGLLLVVSAFFALAICHVLYWSGFFRYALPLYLMLPAIALNFGFLVLLVNRYRPAKNTFPFFFCTINWIFFIEIILEYIGIIEYRNGWDVWDSYTFYWIYVLLLDFIGRYIVSDRFRKPFSSETRTYWLVFVVTFALTIFVIFRLILSRTV